MRLRDAAIAVAATALLAAPALAQQGNWNGGQGYQGTSGQQGYNQGTSQGWNQNFNGAAAGTNGELSQATVMEIQERLQQMGLYHGNIDGNWGPEIQSSLRDYQQQQGMQASGQLDFPTLADLGLLGQQNRQFGNNQYGTQNSNGNQFGNNGVQGWNGTGTNGNAASTNPNYQGQNSYNSGANWNGNNNGMTGTNGYNGNNNPGSNTGSTGYNAENGRYSGYNNTHNNMNSTGTYSTGMNNSGNNGNLNTRFGNGNPNGTTGQQ